MSSKNGSPTFDISRLATLWIGVRQVSLQTLGLADASANTSLRTTRRRVSTVKNRELVQTRFADGEKLICAPRDGKRVMSTLEVVDARAQNQQQVPKAIWKHGDWSKKCQASSIFFCREITRLVLLNRARFGIPVGPCSWRNTTERTFSLFAIPFGQPLPIPSALTRLTAT